MENDGLRRGADGRVKRMRANAVCRALSATHDRFESRADDADLNCADSDNGGKNKAQQFALCGIFWNHLNGMP